MAVANLFDEAHHQLECREWVILEAERQRKVEEAPLSRSIPRYWKQRRVDCEHEITTHAWILAHESIVHEEPAAVSERMGVRLLDGRAAGGPDVREEERRRDMLREFAQVAVVPGWLDALVQAWNSSQFGVPADAKAVAVRRLRSLARVQALVDQRVLSPRMRACLGMGSP